LQNKLSLAKEQLWLVYKKNIKQHKIKFCKTYAPGGTGKTYLINLLMAKVRSSYGIAIEAASSGIAATL